MAIVLDDVIHEVNQPLATIGNSLVELRFALSKAGQNVSGFPALERLESSLSLLAARIDEYRALVIQASTPRDLAPYDLVKEIVEELRQFATERLVRLEVLDRELKTFQLIKSEPFKLKLAFRNLIRNAIQAAELGERRVVTINLFNPKASRNEIVIQVTDSGNGIPEDIQDKIFEKGLTTKPGRGLGLGLSLTASAVRDSGGNIYLENTGPGGSTFVVRLPAMELTEYVDDNIKPETDG
jgi:two-component system C4-dicarboxylate transport sensor histidine kinase DctB